MNTGVLSSQDEAALSAHLAGVVGEFDAQLVTDLEPIAVLCRQVERYRGKMLRPTLAIVSGLAVSSTGRVGRSHHMVGAVLEMIHMATLVHDDVLDESLTRRGGATINAEFGTDAAVLLGDLLISNAFHLCSKIGDPSINLELGRMTNELCVGELLQQHHRGDVGLTEERLLDILNRKTGVLISASCRMGARLAGATPSQESALSRFGTHIGVAFQIQDDVLDLIGREADVGKSVGRDLAKGKLTLPIVFALAALVGAERNRLLAAIQAQDGNTVQSMTASGGFIEASRARARAMVQLAKDELSLIAPSASRDTLGAMADAVIERGR